MQNEDDKALICPICGGNSKLLDVVDFNKSCEENRGKFLPLSGVPIYYSQCETCQFTFANEFRSWSENEFLEKIYNAQYAAIDPDFLEIRPQESLQLLKLQFAGKESQIRHLDYGGGNGRLSQLLRQSGWSSQTYDPFSGQKVSLDDLGKFNLITAFEVFEHVADVANLMRNLDAALDDVGLILFSTFTSDQNIIPNTRLNWWYAAPRNGHISLYSSLSLKMLGQKHGFHFGSFNNALHCYWRKVPDWAKHIFEW